MFNVIFSDRLRLIRLRSGYTLEQFANLYNARFPKSGMNKGTLSKYENNKQEPMFTTVKNIAELLDISIDYLIDSKTTMPIEEFLPADLKELIERYKLCNKEDKEELLMLAKHKSQKNVVSEKLDSIA
jgi:transcriptional regulator with XRE-family HTH domain